MAGALGALRVSDEVNMPDSSRPYTVKEWENKYLKILLRRCRRCIECQMVEGGDAQRRQISQTEIPPSPTRFRSSSTVD